MQKLLSIIIPAYNAEFTIQRALNSILSQQHFSEKLIEIIVVENGSTDNTGTLVNQYVQRYSCVKLLHSKKGVSHARNLGIEQSVGKYMMFVDADDYLLDNILDTLIVDMNDLKSDLICYGHRKFETRNLAVTKENTEFQNEALLNLKQEMLSRPTQYMQVWGKLISRECIGDNRFDVSLQFAEDSDFMTGILLNSRKIVLKRDIVYYYATDTVSTMRSFGDNIVEGYVLAMLATQKKIKSCKELSKPFAKYVGIHFNIAMVRGVYTQLNLMSPVQKRLKLKNAVQVGIFYQAIQNIKLLDLKDFNLLPIYCLKYKFYFLAIQMYQIKANRNAMLEIKEDS